MADILNFPGAGSPHGAQAPAAPQEPNYCTDMISMLRHALELAERGAMQAIAVCWVDGAGTCAEAWVSMPKSSHGLMAAISYLQARYAVEQLSNGKTPEGPEPALPTVS